MLFNNCVIVCMQSAFLPLWVYPHCCLCSCPCYCTCNFLIRVHWELGTCVKLLASVHDEESLITKFSEQKILYLKDSLISQRSCSNQSYLQNAPGIKSFSIFQTGPSCTSFILHWNTMIGVQKQCFKPNLYLHTSFIIRDSESVANRTGVKEPFGFFFQFLISAALTHWSQQWQMKQTYENTCWDGVLC